MIELKKQVITLEQAKRLKELGVEQDSLFYWINCYMNSPEHKWKIVFKEQREIYGSLCEAYSAFTIGELQYMIYEDVSVKDPFEDIEYFITTYGDIKRFNRIIKS